MEEMMDYPYNQAIPEDQSSWVPLKFEQYKKISDYQVAEIKSKTAKEMRDIAVQCLEDLQYCTKSDITDKDVYEYIGYLRKILGKGLKQYSDSILCSNASYSIMLVPKSKITKKVLLNYFEYKAYFNIPSNIPLIKYIHSLMHEKFSEHTITEIICNGQVPCFAQALGFSDLLKRDEWLQCLKCYSPFQFYLNESIYTLTEEEAFEVITDMPRRYEELPRYQKLKKFRNVYVAALPDIVSDPEHIEWVPRKLVTPELYRMFLKSGPTPSQLVYSFHHSREGNSNSPLDYISYDELIEYLARSIELGDDCIPLLLSYTFKRKHMPGRLLNDIVDIFKTNPFKRNVEYMRFIGDSVLRQLLGQRNPDGDIRKSIISYFMTLIWEYSQRDMRFIIQIRRSGILNDLTINEISNSTRRVNIPLLACRKEPMTITTAKDLHAILSEINVSNAAEKKVLDSKLEIKLSDSEFKKFVYKKIFSSYQSGSSIKFLYNHMDHGRYNEIVYACGKNDTIKMYNLICGAGSRYEVDDMRIMNIIAYDTEKYRLREESVLAIKPELLYNNEQEFVKIMNSCFDTQDGVDKKCLNRFLKRLDYNRFPNSVKLVLALKGNITYTASIE